MQHLGYELTCTSHKQHTKNFDELEILEAKLKSDEPIEKSAYRMLPSDERKRFEHWSKIYGFGSTMKIALQDFRRTFAHFSIGSQVS